MSDLNIKKDFPVFEKNPNLLYFDSAATTLRPSKVIERMKDYASYEHANIHRGAYRLSYEATEAYDEVRRKMKNFIHAAKKDKLLFTYGTTDALNTLANSLKVAGLFDKPGKIVLSIFEHHSNIVPWQEAIKGTPTKLEYMYDFTQASLDKIDDSTHLVLTTLMSNATGLIPPISSIIDKAHSVGAYICVDGAQHIGHKPLDVQALNVDFMAFSGHKMFGPTGIGGLFVKASCAKLLQPFRFGGDMIEYVYEDHATYAELPNRMEAGTPNIEGVIGLGAAIDYIESIGIEKIETYLAQVTEYARKSLEDLEEVHLIQPYIEEEYIEYGPVISFELKDVHPHDVSSILDTEQVAIRAGHHCAQPLMHFLDVQGTCRMSFQIYTSKEDVDRFILALKKVRRWLGYGA